MGICDDVLNWFVFTVNLTWSFNIGWFGHLLSSRSQLGPLNKFFFSINEITSTKKDILINFKDGFYAYIGVRLSYLTWKSCCKAVRSSAASGESWDGKGGSNRSANYSFWFGQFSILHQHQGPCINTKEQDLLWDQGTVSWNGHRPWTKQRPWTGSRNRTHNCGLRSLD